MSEATEHPQFFQISCDFPRGWDAGSFILLFIQQTVNRSLCESGAVCTLGTQRQTRPGPCLEEPNDPWERQAHPQIIAPNPVNTRESLSGEQSAEEGGGWLREEKPESFREEEALQRDLEGEMLTRGRRGGRECPAEATLTARGPGGARCQLSR